MKNLNNPKERIGKPDPKGWNSPGSKRKPSPARKTSTTRERKGSGKPFFPLTSNN